MSLLSTIKLKRLSIRFIRYFILSAVFINLLLLSLTIGLSIQATSKHPPIGKFISMNGADIHLVDRYTNSQSTKPIPEIFDSIVLIHGASTSLLDYSENLIPKLSDKYPLIAIDRPGHGYSDRATLGEMHDPMLQAKFVLDAVSQLGVRKPILVGHSWAGSVVMESMLVEHDVVEPIAGIIISGVTHPWNYEATTPTVLSLNKRIGVLFRWLYLTPIGRLMIEPTVAKSFHPEPVPEAYYESVGLNLSLRPKTYLYNSRDRFFLSEHLEDTVPNYASITRPILSITSKSDSVVSKSDHHDKLMAVLNNSHQYVFEQAGHSPHHTRVDTVVEQIDLFIQQLH